MAHICDPAVDAELEIWEPFSDGTSVSSLTTVWPTIVGGCHDTGSPFNPLTD